MYGEACHSKDVLHDLLQHLSRLQSIPLPCVQRLLYLSMTRKFCLEWCPRSGNYRHFCPDICVSHRRSHQCLLLTV